MDNFDDIKSGMIVEYCNEFYEVKENHGWYGTVYELNGKFERTGTIVERFYWSSYGEDCKIVKL